jgi:hypothetical protein
MGEAVDESLAGWRLQDVHALVDYLRSVSAIVSTEIHFGLEQGPFA